MVVGVPRCRILASFAALAAFPRVLRAKEVINLEW